MRIIKFLIKLSKVNQKYLAVAKFEGIVGVRNRRNKWSENSLRFVTVLKGKY